MNQKQGVVWDVVVIGGGPAGMMAAGRAAERGLSVLLLEKNPSLGKKLLITGGGRCNMLNAEEDTRILLSKFKGSDQFLFSAFAQFGMKDALGFFTDRGLETKVEAGKRVFPVSDSAQSVWDVLVQYLQKGGVVVQQKSPVSGFTTKDGQITAVKLKDGTMVEGRSFVLATGGKSRPETGSTGDGFLWLREIGHTVVEPEPSLVPLMIKDAWVKRLQGVTLPDIKVTVLQNGQKESSRKGKVLFTHFGLSGPTVLNMSKEVGELLRYDSVYLSLDLLPTLDYGMLNKKLQDIFAQESRKKFKNSLDGLVHSALLPVIVELSRIDPDKNANSVTREERLALVAILKDIRMEVEGLLGTDKAIITSGGVALTEVDFKTMCSRLYPNLYLVGDILDIDRPSGGYSLQLTWTTGFVAGNSITKKA